VSLNKTIWILFAIFVVFVVVVVWLGSQTLHHTGP